MKTLKKWSLWFDRLFENVAIWSLVTMILIVTLQVITRKLFNYVFFWSEEITLLLLIWFAFMGIAIGVREHLHLAVDSFTAKFPKSVNKVIDKVVSVATFGFGLYLLKYGWDFTILMADSTLPATKLSNSMFYAVMPVSGFMICVYALLQLLGIQTKRHQVGGELH